MFSLALKVINTFSFQKRKNHAEYDKSFIEVKILNPNKAGLFEGSFS